MPVASHRWCVLSWRTLSSRSWIDPASILIDIQCERRSVFPRRILFHCTKWAELSSRRAIGVRIEKCVSFMVARRRLVSRSTTSLHIDGLISVDLIKSPIQFTNYRVRVINPVSRRQLIIEVGESMSLESRWCARVRPSIRPRCPFHNWSRNQTAAVFLMNRAGIPHERSAASRKQNSDLFVPVREHNTCHRDRIRG